MQPGDRSSPEYSLPRRRAALVPPRWRPGRRGGRAGGLAWWPGALGAACILAAAGAAAWQFSPRGYLSNEDSWAPMRAAIELLGTESADRLYETLFFERHIKMQYPPTSLLPLQVLDAAGAGRPRVLNGLNAGFAVLNAALVALLADTLLTPRLRLVGRARWAVLGMAAGSALAFHPIQRGMQLGQIQIWLDLAFTAACLLLARGRDFAAGLTMGFASLVKPQFLPLLLVGALFRQSRFVAGFVLVAGIAGVISVWRYGVHNHVEYLAVLSFIGRHGESFYSNNSVNGVLNRLLGNGSNLDWSGEGFAPFHPLVFALTGATAALLMATPLLVRPARGDRCGMLLHFCLATLCFVMGSPVVWEHHYGILPAMFVVAVDLAHAAPGSRLRPAALIALAFGWLLSALNLSDLTNRLSDTGFNFLQATHLGGGLLLLAVMVRLLQARRAGAPPGGVAGTEECYAKGSTAFSFGNVQKFR